MDSMLHKKKDLLVVEIKNTLPSPASVLSSALTRKAAIDQAINKMLGLSECRSSPKTDLQIETFLTNKS